MAKKLSAEAQAVISASDAGLFLTTLELASSLLQKDPDNVRALLDLGHAGAQLARYEEAERALKSALQKSDPAKRDVILGELGNLERLRGNFESAAEWYQKQIESDPTDATGYIFLGSLRLRLGDLDGAREVLEEGLGCQIGPREELFFALGSVLRSQNEISSATSYFQKALEIDPGYAAAKTALKDLKTAKAAMNRLYD